MNRAQFKQEGDAMLASVNKQMEAIFGAPPATMIADATVYYQILPNDNYTFKTKFYGRDKELVIARAKRMVDGMDYMRSPHASSPVLIGASWEVVVTYYSLD